MPEATIGSTQEDIPSGCIYGMRKISPRSPIFTGTSMENVNQNEISTLF